MLTDQSGPLQDFIAYTGAGVIHVAREPALLLVERLVHMHGEIRARNVALCIAPGESCFAFFMIRRLNKMSSNVRLVPIFERALSNNLRTV